MKLTVVGCSGTYPGPMSACSAYLVEHDGFALVLDLGNGALSELARHTDVLSIDAVFLSHLHGDHCLDLVPYTYARRYPPAQRGPDGADPDKLRVYAPVGAQQRLENAFDRPRPGYTDDVYEFCDVGPGEMTIGPFEVSLARTEHPVECHAIRVAAGGRSLVYTGDTARSAALVSLAAEADLFVCEATYPDGDDNPVGVHMTPAEAGEHADRAGVGRLLLTHLLPTADLEAAQASAASRFDGPVDLARPGALYRL